MKKLEIILPLLFVAFHGLLYNEIGIAVTAARGVDFGPVLMTPLDARIPFLPLMVFPYMIAWIYPVFLVVGLLRKAEVGVLEIRRIFVAILVLELVCYCLWITFPVKVSLRVDDAALAASGWLGSVVKFNYDTATVWHACPSFHVAGPWFFYRAAQLYRVGHLNWFLILFVLITISTVTIRIHYLADIFVGLAVSELVFRSVLRRFEQRRVFDQIPSGIVVTAYLVLLFLAAGGYAMLRF